MIIRVVCKDKKGEGKGQNFSNKLNVKECTSNTKYDLSNPIDNYLENKSNTQEQQNKMIIPNQK